MQEITINLDLQPELRWQELAKYKNETQQLVKCFVDEIRRQQSFSKLFQQVESFWQKEISIEVQQELIGLAKATEIEPLQLILVNLYYDLLKFNSLPAFGCSAFASDTVNGPIHARNLDWWSEDHCLSSCSLIFHFEKNGQRLYSQVSWPGYLGTLSGQSHYKFSITLNTVSSSEAGQWANPISLYIRHVLETATNYNDAVELLSQSPLMNDCLLLVTGIKKDEYCVIERSPNNSNIRQAKAGLNSIVATNSYLTAMRNNTNLGLVTKTAQTEIFNSACDRYNTLHNEVSFNKPQSIDDCFYHLKSVMMLITAQQMVFMPAQGKLFATSVGL